MSNSQNEIINLTNNNCLGIEDNVRVDEEINTVEDNQPVANIKTPRALTIMKKDKIIYFDCCEIL